MKLKSSMKITTQYNTDEVIGNKVLVNFIDLSTEVVEEKETEQGKTIEYIYDAYQIELVNDIENIETNYTTLLAQAKQHEYNVVAEEVRLKRKTLLEETDNYAMTDRVMSDEMKVYRQALRDIPSQEGFPYNVIYPVKPEK